MRRREFITLLGSAAAFTWPLAVRAQQAPPMRRIAVVTGLAGNDPETKVRTAAFLQELQRLGWIEGSNIRVEVRGVVGASPAGRKNVAELIALKPDVILAIGNAGIPPLLELARSVPIVFTVVVDPVGAGFVQSLARRGGNVTGFLMFEYSLSGKWPELLKQLAPSVTRAAVLRDPALPAGIGQFAVIQAMAPAQGLDVTAVNVGDEQEIARGIETFAQSPAGGLIVTASAQTVIHLKLIVAQPNIDCQRSIFTALS